MKKIITSALALLLPSSAFADDAEQLSFKCDFMLLVNQNPQQFSAPSPVEIRFKVRGEAYDAISVVDKGAILYPGAAMALTQNDGVITLGGTLVPSERPGAWSVSRKDDRFSFKLTHDEKTVVSFVLSVAALNDDGEHIAIWNASNHPKGMPQPLKGAGIGYCKPNTLADSEK